jgi:hypothetical protein
MIHLRMISLRNMKCLIRPGGCVNGEEQDLIIYLFQVYL